MTVRTRAEILSDVATSHADNTNREISAEDTRQRVIDLAESSVLPEDHLGINAATAKTTPVDADLFGLIDSAASNVLKKLTFANLKTALGFAAKLQTETVGSWLIETVSDGDYRLRLNVGYGFTITKVTTRAGAGTCTATVKINTTALGGTANSVSTTEQAQAHASANVVVAGDDVVLTISGNSACTDLTIEIEGTRTLA